MLEHRANHIFADPRSSGSTTVGQHYSALDHQITLQHMVDARTQQVNPSEHRCNFAETPRIEMTKQHLAVLHQRIHHRREIVAAGLKFGFRKQQFDPWIDSFDNLALLLAELHGARYLHEPSASRRLWASQPSRAGEPKRLR